MFEKINHYVVRLVEVFCCGLLFCLAVDVLIGISDRFLFHIGFAWPEELARFLFIWLGPVTAAILVQRREHFDFPMLIDKIFPEGTTARRIFEFIISVTMVGLMILLFILGLRFAEFAKFQNAAALPISMSYVYLSIPTGALLMLFFFLGNMYSDIKKAKISKAQ